MTVHKNFCTTVIQVINSASTGKATTLILYSSITKLFLDIFIWS